MPKFKGYLLLDRCDIFKPNIVSNVWSDEAMEYLPKNYFDEIILERFPSILLKLFIFNVF